MPLKYYALQVAIFFVVSTLNNIVFGFNIPMPLHIIFRSGSLLVNMLMGVLLLSKRYGWPEYTGVVLTTLGVIIATLESADDATKQGPDR